MKLLITSFCLLFCCSLSFSQPKGVHLYQIKDRRLIHALSMMDTTITRANSDMTVKLYHIWNELGSAHIPEDDEVSESYMVSIGEDQGSEMPADRLFSLGEFYSPKLLEFKQIGHNKFSIIIKHWNKNWKTDKFIVTRKNVLLIK